MSSVIAHKAGDPTAPAIAPPLLSLQNLQVVYGGVIEAVRDVSLSVPVGQVVALLGSNGAGKSTVLKAMSGVLDAEDGEIVKGSVVFAGRPIERTQASDIVMSGLIQVPEGRRLFASLTVEENLMIGAYLRSRASIASSRDYVYNLFPRLAELRPRTAGYLSGGEQQMVAIGRALMGSPKLLALDEPSLGLAPLIVEEIFSAIRELRAGNKLTILLVEQNANLALGIADYAYIMENGRLVLDGPSEALQRNADVRDFYLGIGNSGAKSSLRDVKHYKRRKRWLS